MRCPFIDEFLITFMINNKTDALKNDVSLVFTTSQKQNSSA